MARDADRDCRRRLPAAQAVEKEVRDNCTTTTIDDSGAVRYSGLAIKASNVPG
jgi:hypothetical protein